MKKYLILAVTLFLSLTLTGCFGDDNGEVVTPENGEQTEQGNGETSGRSISNLEEVDGTEAIYERFPGSVRTNHVEGTFSIFVAEATVEDVLDHYQNIANEIGVDWFYEQVPEEQPHWVTAYHDNTNPELGGFALTLGEEESTCDGCVSWVFYTRSWESE